MTINVGGPKQDVGHRGAGRDEDNLTKHESKKMKKHKSQQRQTKRTTPKIDQHYLI